MRKKLDRGRHYASGYGDAGASLTRRAMKGFTATSSSPNEDIDWNNATLRQRGRILTMSTPIAASAINTNRSKVIGTGLTLKSSINRDVLGLSQEAAEAWERKTEAEFRMWASRKENCDDFGMNNFAELQQLALVCWLTSGDVFAVLPRREPTELNPYGLRVHLVEADLVSTPTDGLRPLKGGVTDGKAKNGNLIYDGVEVDENGRVVAYHICNQYPTQRRGVDKEIEWKRVEVCGKESGLPSILHIMSSERAGQYRGVTYLAPVIEHLLQLRRYTESSLMAALVQSFFTAWVQTENNPDELPFNEVGDGVEDSVNGSDEASIDNENEYEMGAGTINVLKPGETVQFGNPNIPSQAFEGFVNVICTHIGSALDLPREVLLKEFNASYSAARGALLEAWEAIRMRRKWFVDNFCAPVYEIWLTEAVSLGRIKAPGFFTDPLIRDAWCNASWIGPTQGSIDPQKETKAAIAQVSYGFKTHEQVTREMGGGDWSANVAQLKTENEKLAEARGAVRGQTAPPTEPTNGGNNNEGGNNNA